MEREVPAPKETLRYQRLMAQKNNYADYKQQ